MIIYNHSTPEKLITKYYSVEQLREYPVCELSKDVPSDLLTTTNFTIVERKDTMNLDLSLAVLYNNITDLDSALQFTRILVINGPRIDTKTIIFYVDRINNGPFGDQIGNFVTRHFEYARNGRKITNISNDAITTSDIYDYDQNFINQLIDAAKDCLYAPCNYFNYSSGMGLLDNPEYIPSINSTPPGDYTQDIAPPGVPVSKSIYNKILPTVQNNLLMMKQSLMTMGKNVTSLFYSEQELNDQDKAFKAGYSAYNTSGASQVVVDGRSRPDYTTYFAFQKAKLAVMSITANVLGDCGRINAFFRQYNPYDPEQNLDNVQSYYNPYARSFPGRTNLSLGTEQVEVLNHNTPSGEIEVVNGIDGAVVSTVHSEDGFTILNTDVITSTYGHLVEFGSVDDPYIGKPNGESSWDVVYGGLIDRNSWLGNTAIGEVVNLIEQPLKYKQTISTGNIKIGTDRNSEATNYIRTANGPVNFKNSHCALSPELGSYLTNELGINRGDWITILFERGGIKSTMNLRWVDTTAPGLEKWRVDIFTKIQDLTLNSNKVLGIKKLGANTTAEVKADRTKGVVESPQNTPNRNPDDLTLPPGVGNTDNSLLPPIPGPAETPQGNLDLATPDDLFRVR